MPLLRQDLWGLNCHFCVHPSGRDLGDIARLRGGVGGRADGGPHLLETSRTGITAARGGGLVDAGQGLNPALPATAWPWGGRGCVDADSAVGEPQHLGAGLGPWSHRKVCPGFACGGIVRGRASPLGVLLRAQEAELPRALDTAHGPASFQAPGVQPTPAPLLTPLGT